jgi:hypothetical protein
LISTESGLAQLRYAPIPGLLEELIDQGLRARQRRNFTVDHPAQTLAALRVPDGAIDRAVHAATLYGAEAIPLLDQRIAEASGGTQDAAIFLRIAFAVQIGEEDIVDLVVRYWTDHPHAVHEALRFFPIPHNRLQDDSSHIITLFEQTQQDKALASLAIRLAGERDVKALREAIELLIEDPYLAADAHFALACMGHATQTQASFVQQCLQSDDPTKISEGLRICAVDTRLVDTHDLKNAIDVMAHEADVAWAILACHYPRQTFLYAMGEDEQNPALKVRLAALAGYPDWVVALCGELAQREGCITPAEADVLNLVLGKVPVEARTEPNDTAAKSRALRQLLLQVFQQAHVAVHNDADRCPWQVDLILADLEQAASIRLRNGKRMTKTLPVLGQAVFRVTHPLRQWLYIERALLGQHALALSAHDVSRRQELAMMIAEVADELQDD